MWPFAEVSRVWTGYSVWITMTCTMSQTSERSSPVFEFTKSLGREGRFCVHHFIPVYFHGASVEISEVSANLVQISRSFVPWSSESVYTT